MASTSILKNCEIHNNSPCDLLYFKLTDNDPLLCQECAKIQNIPQNQLFKVSEIMKLKPTDILPGNFGYLLSDPSLLERITKNQKALQETIQDYKQFYKKIAQYFKERQLKSINESDSKLEKLRNAEKDLVNSYRKVIAIDSLKKILSSNSSDQMQTLKEFIKQTSQEGLSCQAEIQAHCLQFEQQKTAMGVINLAGIQDSINNLFKQTELFKNSSETILSPNNQKIPAQDQFPADIPLIVAQVPSNDSFVPQIPSFPSFSIPSIQISPSMNYRNSAKNIFVLNEEMQNSILITNRGEQSDMEIAQCYITQPLNKTQKYVIRIQICHKSLDPTPGYAFGLALQECKDHWFLCNEGISYSETKGRDISKIVKGKQLHSGMNKSIEQFNNKIIEFRIDLGNKFFRAADYPEYKNVSELDIPSRINDNQIYYFAIYIEKSPNSVRIVNAFAVDQFDEQV